MFENDTLKFFGSPEGRAVMRLTAPGYDYEYSIADHQGNTRVVFSSVTPQADSVSTNFVANSNAFDGDDTNLSGMSEMSYGADAASQRLTGGYTSQIGTTKNFKVYPGDVVSVKTFAKYRVIGSSPGNLDDFAPALAGAFGLSPSSTGTEFNAYQSMTAFGSFVETDDRPLLSDDPFNEVAPRGFITILLFDKDKNLIDAGWDQIDVDYSQTGTSPKEDFDELHVEMLVKEAGYAYIFLSNENPTQVDIHFDELTLVHKKTNVIQYNEYYPFGLQASTSWTRENSSNPFLYNEGSELNNTSGMICRLEIMMRRWEGLCR